MPPRSHQMALFQGRDQELYTLLEHMAQAETTDNWSASVPFAILNCLPEFLIPETSPVANSSSEDPLAGSIEWIPYHIANTALWARAGPFLAWCHQTVVEQQCFKHPGWLMSIAAIASTLPLTPSLFQQLHLLVVQTLLALSQTLTAKQLCFQGIATS